MKLQKESREIDLYVSNKRMTAKEAKEFSDFIEQVKKKEMLKKSKHRKAA
jgi:hypothetical protein